MPAEIAGDEVAVRGDLVICNGSGVGIHDGNQRPSPVAQYVASNILVGVPVDVPVVHVDKPIGITVVVAYEPCDKLNNSFENVRPGADNIGDNSGNVITYVLTPAVTSEDPAEEVANSTHHAADRIANGL